jgi:hypothetical protein
MAISSSSVIHYTNKLDNLKGIINSKGFRVKYCLETLNIDLNNEMIFAVPMVSFCDIPLSEVKNHIKSYGSYGIGLSKDWAKNNSLNPVLYLEKESYISKTIKSLIIGIRNLREEKNQDRILQKGILKLFSFCKNYEGYLKHGEIDDENYCFYNEREWRYVPSEEYLVSNEIEPLIIGKEFLERKVDYNIKLKDTYCFFEPKDISYIIVDNENEIPDILSILNDVYEDGYSAKVLKILGTKIITKHQIFCDF